MQAAAEHRLAFDRGDGGIRLFPQAPSPGHEPFLRSTLSSDRTPNPSSCLPASVVARVKPGGVETRGRFDEFMAPKDADSAFPTTEP